MDQSLINYESLSAETRDWLESLMDFVPNSGEAFARRCEAYRKQTRVTRRCASRGHSIRGNVYFRHIKACGRPQYPKEESRKRLPVANDLTRAEAESSLAKG